MSRVLTFSRVFPSYHPKAGQPTYFVEKIIYSLHALNIPIHHWKKKLPLSFLQSTVTDTFEPKYHTVRAGRRWKVGDKFSPRVWSGKPYRSKQITFAPDIEVKKVWEFEIEDSDRGILWVNSQAITIEELNDLALNDGLTTNDLLAWFRYPKASGPMQIICWNESIEY